MADGGRAPALVDLHGLDELHGLAQTGADRRAIWARETGDLDVNVVAFPAGGGVAAHVNDQVDVLLVVSAGTGVVEIDGRPYQLAPGVLVLIPKGTRRAVRSTADRLVYVTCHRRRPGLRPVAGRRRP